MDQDAVDRLEREIATAISSVLVKKGLRKLPYLPSQHTMHLMAKAAVSVYEAVAEESRRAE